ncbi:hypothetical protein [Thermaurantiacus sp.]
MATWPSAHAQEAAPAPSEAPREAPQEAPTSLLPDIFDAPRPAVQPDEPGELAAPRAGPAGPPQAMPPATPLAGGAPQPAAAPPPEEAPEEPGGPVRDARFAGLLSLASQGFSPGIFAGSDGRFLAALLNRLEGPLALRWGQIVVQRALASQALPPPGIAPGDWLAARTRALVSLGAAVDAHRMVMRVQRSDYTPRLYAAAAQAALAAADPLGLCPLAAPGRLVSDDNPAFVLADAWCMALAGDPFSANQLLTEARRRRIADNFDIQLAQRIASLGGGGRDAGNPVWREVKGLTAWRVGLADAAGIAVPDALVGEAPAVVRAWMVRHARLPVGQRAALAPEATGLGALLSAELRRILALEASDAPAGEMAKLAGGQLRLALQGSDPATIISQLEALASRAPAGSAASHGYLIAVAEAAARIRPSTELAQHAPFLVEAMVAGGYLAAAEDWWPIAQQADRDLRARTWAVLAPLSASLPQDDRLLEQLAEASSPRRAALLSAGLHGLGRGVGDPPAAMSNSWTKAMDEALRARRTGEMLVLAATGLQGPLAELPPDHFRRIIEGLRAAGLEEEARMMVAEVAIRG